MHFSKTGITWKLIAVLSMGLFTRCAQLQSDMREAVLAGAGPQTKCRYYVTSYTTGGNIYTCSWNNATLQLICNGPTNTYTYQYPSLKKFITEPNVVGKLFLTSIVITGSGASTIIYSYDSSDRLAGSTITVPSVATLNYSYSTFDGSGRPLTGTYNISASGFTCINASVSRSYNDAARTMFESVSGGTGAICAASSSTSTYDAVTGIDIQVVASPGGTTTKTINSTSQICE